MINAMTVMGKNCCSVQCKRQKFVMNVHTRKQYLITSLSPRPGILGNFNTLRAKEIESKIIRKNLDTQQNLSFLQPQKSKHSICAISRTYHKHFNF